MVALELRVIRSCVRHFPGPSRVNVPSADRFPEEVGFFGNYSSPVLTRDGKIAPKPVVEVDGGIVESVPSDQFELDVMLTRRPNRESLPLCLAPLRDYTLGEESLLVLCCNPIGHCNYAHFWAN
ncbi:hypothetical protein TNCV_3989391 [Trichonephila clavipes]|nr:hypothetical protein TNCV_3989391 [Trichonephila clavipes]